MNSEILLEFLKVLGYVLPALALSGLVFITWKAGYIRDLLNKKEDK